MAKAVRQRQSAERREGLGEELMSGCVEVLKTRQLVFLSEVVAGTKVNGYLKSV